MNPKTVLIVCTGNICRSPMAYGLLKAKLDRLGLSPHIRVETAGTFALDGEPPSPEAQRVLAERGIDISHHRARTVTPEMLRRADLVIAMTERHRRSLFFLLPEAGVKILLLSELVGEHKDIKDPYGGPYEGYVRTADLLEDYLERGLPTLLSRLDVSPPDEA